VKRSAPFGLYEFGEVMCGQRALLRYGGAVAGTVRQVGQGRAWLLGTYAGHNGTAYRDEEPRAFARALFAECGVRPAHQGQLLLRKRAMAGQEAWLFTNPTAHDVTERVDVSGWAHVEDLLGEPLERDGDEIVLTVESLDIRGLVLQK